MLNNLKDLDDFINVNNINLTTIVYEGINNRKNIIDNINGILLPENLINDKNTNINALVKNEVRKYKLNKILDKGTLDTTKQLSGNIKKVIIEYEKRRYSLYNNKYINYRKSSLNSEYGLVITIPESYNFSDSYSSKMPKRLLYESELVVSLLGNGNIKVIKNRYV
jgi:hypothetical protein